MINTARIHERIGSLRITKAQLMSDSGLSRVTIDKILNGGNVNVETLEAFAKSLGVNVGFFFDDNIGESGQTMIGGSNNRLGSHNLSTPGDVDMGEHDELIRLREETKFLREETKYLKQLLSDKDERIAELKERIEELKNRQ